MSIDCIEVSVIVPTYNCESYIELTVRSILAQTFKNFELILVDDCSSDSTWKILNRLQSEYKNIKCVRLDKNSGGPAKPRNIGVKHASSNLIAFCDSDDLWSPIKLETQLAFFRSKGVDFVCTQILEFTRNEQAQLLFRPIDLLSSHKINYLSNFIKNRIATSSVLCNKNQLIDVGGFDEDRSLIAVEDYDLWLRLMELENYYVLKIDAQLVGYRTSINSLSAGKLKHSIKVMKVLYRASCRNNRGYIFYFFCPLIYFVYGLVAFYNRIILKKI